MSSCIVFRLTARLVPQEKQDNDPREDLALEKDLTVLDTVVSDSVVLYHNLGLPLVLYLRNGGTAIVLVRIWHSRGVSQYLIQLWVILSSCIMIWVDRSSWALGTASH